MKITHILIFLIFSLFNSISMATGIGPPDFGVLGNILVYGGVILLPILLVTGGIFIFFKILSIIIKYLFPKKEMTKETIEGINSEREVHEIKVKNEENYKEFL